MENPDKSQVQVKDVKVGDTALTLNGDRWKIISMETCNRAGALEKGGDYFQVVMQGPNKKKVKNVWHRESKVWIPKV